MFKTKSLTLKKLILSLSLFSLLSFAQEEGDFGDGKGDMPVVAPEIIPAEKNEKPKNPKDRFRKSKLSRDTTEGVADRRRILLSSGEDKVVDLDFDIEKGKAGIQIGNTTMIMVQTIKVEDQIKQIVFKPLKQGETTVSIRDTEGNIKIIFDVVVTANNLLRRAGEIRELLKDVDGLDIKVVGQRVVIDGEVLVPNDYGRLMTVITDATFKDVVLNLARLSPLALKKVSDRIQEDINSFAPNVKTRVVNQMIFLEGTVDDQNQAARAVNVAYYYIPDQIPGELLAKRSDDKDSINIKNQKSDWVKNLIIVNPPPPKKTDKLVRVLIHYVELGKDYSRNLGFRWAPLYSAEPSVQIGQQANGDAGASGQGFFATISSLLPKLRTAQNAGYARVIKEGAVVIKNGEAGSFRDQVSVYVPGLNAQGNSQIQPTNVGFEVSVKPQILGQSEDIQIGVKVDNSAVIGRAPGSVNPLISTKSITTMVYVKNNESAAIAGVTANEVSTDFNRDPLGDTTTTAEPVFDFKRTKAYKKRNGQFVIFLTPQLIDNASDGSEELKKSFRIKK